MDSTRISQSLQKIAQEQLSKECVAQFEKWTQCCRELPACAESLCTATIDAVLASHKTMTTHVPYLQREMNHTLARLLCELCVRYYDDNNDDLLIHFRSHLKTIYGVFVCAWKKHRCSRTTTYITRFFVSVAKALFWIAEVQGVRDVAMLLDEDVVRVYMLLYLCKRTSFETLELLVHDDAKLLVDVRSLQCLVQGDFDKCSDLLWVPTFTAKNVKLTDKDIVKHTGNVAYATLRQWPVDDYVSTCDFLLAYEHPNAMHAVVACLEILFDAEVDGDANNVASSLIVRSQTAWKGMKTARQLRKVLRGLVRLLGRLFCGRPSTEENDMCVCSAFLFACSRR